MFEWIRFTILVSMILLLFYNISVDNSFNVYSFSVEFLAKMKLKIFINV